ncbi:hypothetical protein B0H16DRAFT_1498110 [Mycena metata]|uniref:Uncharacterized protein n=1 Tax=Mycena metata TaxID=1033252 RepID=A0AAD7KA29_9AGAR|nr:hypothetical protein B0H16DRAFT_1498110 [Mycena metata]
MCALTHPRHRRSTGAMRRGSVLSETVVRNPHNPRVPRFQLKPPTLTRGTQVAARVSAAAGKGLIMADKDSTAVVKALTPAAKASAAVAASEADLEAAGVEASNGLSGEEIPAEVIMPTHLFTRTNMRPPRADPHPPLGRLPSEHPKGQSSFLRSAQRSASVKWRG